MSEGIFPDHLKGAIVRSLLKKSGLDVNENKNFRPVSNLPFLGKVIEKEVCKQIMRNAINTGKTEKNSISLHKK